jgi:hypothetical protein
MSLLRSSIFFDTEFYKHVAPNGANLSPDLIDPFPMGSANMRITIIAPASSLHFRPD